MANLVTRAKALRLARLILTLVVAWSLVAWAAAQALIVHKELHSADIIVVLAGSTAYVERVRYAAELLHKGRAPRIILTNDSQRGGWSQEKEINPLFVVLASEELQKLGVSSNNIEIVAPLSSGTYQEAIALREYAEKHKLASLLIVTSAYHSRRALWTFSRVFEGSNIEVGIDPAPPGQQSPLPWSWWLYLRGWEAVPVEYVKMLYYRLRF